MEQHRHRLLSLLLLLVWPPVFLAPRAQPEEIPKVDLSKLSLEDLLPSLPFESRRALAEREILQPSPIQALALPHIGSGKHAVLVSETGSGKTLAYLLPAVERAREADEERRKSTGPSSVMILTPTRELAVQILAEVEDHCQGIIALVTLSARASWYTLMDASVIIGTPADILDVFDEEDAEEVKDLLGRIEVIILDELDELLPKNKFTGRRLARYQDPGMWPAEGLLKRLMRNNERESLQLVAASATAYLSSRLRLERILQRDKLKRFPAPLPRLDPQRSTATVVEAAAALREEEDVDGPAFAVEMRPERLRRHGTYSYRALPEGIQHFSWKVPLSGSHAAAVAAALEKLRPESALIFVCPNAEETVKSVVKDLATAGWSNVDALSRMLFPDSRNTAPGKKASQAKGEAKGWRSANRLVDLRDTTRRGYSTEGDFYREAPIFVSAEESVRGLHLDAVQVVFILGLPKTASSYVHMAGRTGRLPHPYGKAVIVAHGREVAKVTNGFMDEIGIKCEPLGWGSPRLEDVADLVDPTRRSSHTWLDDLQSEEEKQQQRSEAGSRLDAALGPPVRRLRRSWAKEVAPPS